MSKREELKEHVRKMVDGLVVLMRDAAKEAVDAAFAEGEETETAPAPSKPRKTMRSARAVRALPAASSGAVTVAMIVDVVRRNPSCNGGTIGRELGKPRHTILKPLSEAVATGKIRKNGSGRGLTYTAR